MVAESLDAEIDDMKGLPPAKYKFQKEHWQLRYLPYYSELEAQANRHFSEIKAGLAHSIALNDIRYGFDNWSRELAFYIHQYGLRFSKEEHVTLVKMYLCFIQKGSFWRQTKRIIRFLTQLLDKYHFLSREDLIIDWRPLYELYIEIAYKNLENKVYFNLPPNFKADLRNLIVRARRYFSSSATQELLDETRPLMCIWDDSSVRAWDILDLFLPMRFSSELHQIEGNSLWFEEAWHWYVLTEKKNGVDEHIVNLFDRLTYECPDSIDWTPKLDIIFTKIMRLLKLFSIDGAKGTIATSKYPEWIANLLGSRCHDAVMKHLKSILDMAEDLLHPSNHGSHSKNLLTFFKDFSERIICRISRESDEDSNILKFANKFPKEMRLTDQLLNELTKMFLPSLKLIIFTKVDQRLANEILRSFARFSPEMIIPMILEIKQPGEFGMSMIIQSISILKQLIPELNFNEYDKCEAVLNLMTRLFGMMILVDSSEAIHARSDLTEVERKLCIMTSSFEDMLNSFMDKMFTKFIDCGLSITPTDSYSGIAIKEKLCHEELTIHCTLIRIYRCICNNTGTAFHKTVTDRLFNFIAENIHENEQYSLTVTNLVLIAVRSSEKSCFSRFFNLIFDRLQSVLVPEVYIKEKIDFEVIWWLRMMSRAVRVSAATLLENWTDIRKLFELVIQQVWRCPEATQLTTLILESVLQGLTSIEFINLDRRAKFDQPFERYLPIRHWAFEFDKENYEFRWNVPTNESIQRATEVFRDFVMPHVEALNQPEGRDKKEIHHRLLVIRDFFDGACFSLPLLEGPIIPGTYDSHVHQWHETNIVRSSSIPEMSYNGCNIRQVLLDCVKNLLCHLLKQSKDDCKSIRTSIFILYEILYFRGFDKEKYKNAKKDYDNLKRISTFGTFSTKFDISFIVEHSIVLLHNRRISYNNMWNVKKQHVDVLNLLIEASTDEYSQVRSNAQKYVRQIWADFPHSYEKVLDKVVDYLNPSNNPTHEQMKGALHLLIDGGEASVLIVEDYRSMIKLWSTIIKMQCSDRQSIIKLFTDAYSTLSKNYSTVQIKFEVPDSVRKTAMQLLALNYGSPVNVKRSDLTDQQIGHYANHLEEIYDQMKRDYCELANHIVSTTQDSSLHWRHLGLASYMLELLLRKDEEFPEEGVKLYASQLTHDILEIRKTARARLSTWLGIIKKKSIKMDYTIPCKNPNLTTGAKWPIEYGIRDDNQWLIYEEDKLPQNEKEWNKTHVICKKHYGFYTWPDKLRRSPLEYQASLCRTLEELNPIELHIAKILTDPQFIDRMLQLFIHDTDEKNTNLFFLCFFCKIFRVFGYILLPYYKDKIETLLQSPKENIQALGIQITRTILIASKFWKWEQQQDLWQWIEPVLHTALVNINEDNLSKWVDSVREICMLLDPQQLKPLFDVLFSLVNRPADNPFAASARLMLVRKAVSKLKWRGLGLHRKIFDVIKKNPISQFTNQCDSIARTLTTITAFDIPSLFVSPNLPDSLKPIKTTEVIETYAELLKACWNEVRFDLNSCENLHESKRDEGATKANTCSESKKRSRLALKILALYVDKAVRKFHYSFRPEFVELIPLFAHFSSDLGDEELAMDCRLAIRAMSFMHIYENQQASQVIELFRKTSISHCWWKTKLWMIRRMRTLFISNFFVFKPHAHTICEILLAFLVDNQLEVRNASSDSLVDLIQSSLIEVTTVLIDKFTSFTNSDSTLTKHSGVLGLSAIVNAFPYTIPPFMPDILMTICKFATSPNPIQNEVKRTMAGFKKTHNDSWREHKEHFNEDQLLILRNLMAFEHRKSLPQSRVPGLPNNSKIPVPITANQQNGENSKESTPTSNKTTPILAVTKQQPQPKPKMAEVKQEVQSSAVSNGKPILAEKKTTNLKEIETQTEEEEKKCLSDKSTECRPVALNFGTQTTEPEPAPEIIKLDKAIMAQIIEIVDEESRSAERKQIEQLQTENATLRLKVDRMQREETEASTSREALLAEIESLRQQVAESNNYLDQVDVEAEQQYTELTGEIDELIEVVQKKDAEIAAFKEQLAEKQKTEAKLNENVESYKAVMQRQKEIIENLREELDAEIAKSAQLLKEKERLTKEATTAKERMSESMLAKEALISIQLDDLHRELDKQKTIINGTSVAQIVNKWEKRVEALENSLRERDVIIHTQSQLIKELRRGTQTPSPNQISSGSNNNNLHRHSTSNGHPQRSRRHASASNNSSMDSFYRDGLDPRSRDQLLNFIMSDRPAQLANIFAIGRILDLNPHEEKLIERFLARETYG